MSTAISETQWETYHYIVHAADAMNPRGLE